MGPALIVADDNQAGKRFAEFFQGKGLTATVWEGALLEAAQVAELRPELILVASKKPRALQVCQQLKLDPRTNLIPLIIVEDDVPADRGPGYYFAANAAVQSSPSNDDLQRAVDVAQDWREAARQEEVHAEFQVRLHSDLKLLDELNRHFAEHLRQRGLPEPEAKQVTMAVRELGANAIEWGHRRDIDRVVHIQMRIHPRKVTVVIRDTGPGFNRNDLPHAAHPDDPISHLSVREELGLREGGFGIMIAGGLVDELHYNDVGNEVRVVKHLAAPPQATRVP